MIEGFDVSKKLEQLRGNVTSYAFETIKNELIDQELANKDPKHVSHATDATKCLCTARRNYRLPCRHILVRFPGVIPLNIVHQRWRIFYVEGKGKRVVVFIL